jgi:phage recombination protein Bet
MSGLPTQALGREIELKPAQLSLIRRTLAADCTDAEFDLLIEIARRVKADPFKRHIYAVVFSKDDPKKRRVSFICGIDFYRSVAARNRDYRPDDSATVYEYDDAMKSPTNPTGLVKALVHAWKYGPDGKWYAVVGEALWVEYVPLEDTAERWDWIETGDKWPDGKAKKRKQPVGEVTQRPQGKWLSMPTRMLSKCAEAQALRKGWPEDLSGVYVEEEMDRAKQLDLTASEYAEQADVEKRLALTGSRDSIMILWAPGAPLEAVPLGKFMDRALAFVQSAKSADELTGWRDSNRAPINDFWAKKKSDALALRNAIDDRIKELSAT